MNQAVVRSGMMFAAVPPSRMIPWTRAVGTELLAPESDRAEQQDHRVERVAALPRVRRGVRLEAVEHHVDVLRGERPALDVVAVAGVVHQRRVEAGHQPVVDHDLLAAPPLLGRGAEEHDLAGQLVGHRGEGDRRAHARRPPWCCGRSRARARGARRTRRGSRSAGRRRRARRAARRGSRWPGCRPGARPSNPCRASTSATAAAARCSSNAVSGSAWIRCDRSRISSRAASTAAAMRAFWSAWGSAGVVAVSDGNGQAPTRSGAAWTGRDGA